jgi:23S rRNA pseudouridine1911/1915/1917 synthase
MELEILLEDGPLIAVNKPPGLLTQGVPHGHPTLEAWVKQHLKQKYCKPGSVYLGVPHRLDRPVSGIVVFAKNSKAAARLAEQFRERTVRKFYLAVTERVPDRPADRLTDWLLKDAANAHVSVVEPGTEGAREAILDYRVLDRCQNRALVEVELQTGRMHQIRVQLASRGWNIVGDLQYGATLEGRAAASYDRLVSPIALHARRLSLAHPIRYDRIELQAPVPSTWEQFAIPPEWFVGSTTHDP